MRMMLPVALSVTFISACNGIEDVNLNPQSAGLNPETKTVPIDALFPLSADELPRTLDSSSSSNEIAARSIDPNYSPPCSVIDAGTAYTLSGTVTGQWYCFNIQTIVSNPVKTIAKLLNQVAGENHNVYTLQWNVTNQNYDTVASSTLTDNSNDIASAISDDGHYVMYIETVASTGESFTIAFDAVTNYDSHELNDVGGDSVPISASSQVVGNIDNYSDIDFFTYTTAAGEYEIDLYANLTSGQTLFLNINGAWVEFDKTENPNGANENTYSVTPNTDIMIAITQIDGAAWSSDNYGFVVQESNPVTNLTGHSVLSYNAGTGNYFNQTMPFFYKNNGGQLASGAYSRIRFIGQLHGPNGPAAFKRVKLNYTRGTPSFTSQNFEELAFTDANGWFVFLHNLSGNSLYECRDRKSTYHDYSYPTPDTLFRYDANNYSITAKGYNGDYTYVDDENVFWLCYTSAPSDYTYWN